MWTRMLLSTAPSFRSKTIARVLAVHGNRQHPSAISLMCLLNVKISLRYDSYCCKLSQLVFSRAALQTKAVWRSMAPVATRKSHLTAHSSTLLVMSATTPINACPTVKTHIANHAQRRAVDRNSTAMMHLSPLPTRALVSPRKLASQKEDAIGWQQLKLARHQHLCSVRIT